MSSPDGELPLPGMEACWTELQGHRMRYHVGGSGAPLVLVHGIAASSFSFRFNSEPLSRKFRVFVPDLPNMGYSDPLSGVEVSLHATALRLGEFLKQTVGRRTHVLASSHGGSVAMELAAIAPELLSKLVLVSPANPFARSYDLVVKFYLSTIGREFMRMVPHLPGWAWDYGIGRMYADTSRMRPGTGIGYARPLRRPGVTQHVLKSLQTFSADVAALRPKLPAISRVPNLLIWGDRDPVVDLESGYKLREALWTRMEVLPGVGHLPYEEVPELFNNLVLDFLLEPSPA